MAQATRAVRVNSYHVGRRELVLRYLDRMQIKPWQDAAGKREFMDRFYQEHNREHPAV
jgi:hypothetical protein